MYQIWIALNPLDRVFLVCALVGAGLFLIRLIIGMFGGDGDGLDADFDLDSGGDFQIISLHTLTAFFLVFGLAGLALHRGSGFSDAIAVIGAFACGVAMMGVIARLTQMVQQLHSSGTLDINRAVGCTGIVYLRIPAGGGFGKVHVDIDGRLVELEALAADKSEIATGERVSVVEVVQPNILVVRLYEPTASAPNSSVGA